MAVKFRFDIPKYFTLAESYALWFELALAAFRTKDTFFKAKYHKLATRQSSKKAIIAKGYSILNVVYHVLNDGAEYRELGADYVAIRH